MSGIESDDELDAGCSSDDLAPTLITTDGDGDGLRWELAVMKEKMPRRISERSLSVIARPRLPPSVHKPTAGQAVPTSLHKA